MKTRHTAWPCSMISTATCSPTARRSSTTSTTMRISPWPRSRRTTASLRQGVRDVIVRAEAILTELEDKTGIIRRFHKMQEQFGQMETAVDAIAQRNEAHWQDDELEALCGQLKGVLAQLKQE